MSIDFFSSGIKIKKKRPNQQHH